MNAPVQNAAESVERAFYEAFQRLDLTLMSAIWLDGAKPVCIHPGGPLLQGKEAVLRSWAEIFSGAEPPVVEYRLLDRFESEALAVHLVEEHIRPGSAPTERVGRVLATNVYVKVGGAWFMAEHHASLPLVEPHRDAPESRSIH